MSRVHKYTLMCFFIFKFGIASDRFSLGSGDSQNLSTSLHRILVAFYELRYPHANVVAWTARLPDKISSPNFLRNTAFFHKHLILDGRKITPSSSAFNAPNSIIQARYSSKKYVGQVQYILTHTQPGCGTNQPLLHVRWFEPLTQDILDDSIWQSR